MEQCSFTSAGTVQVLPISGRSGRASEKPPTLFPEIAPGKMRKGDSAQMMCAKIKGPGCSSVCCNAVTSVCFQMLQHGASNVKS